MRRLPVVAATIVCVSGLGTLVGGVHPSLAAPIPSAKGKNAPAGVVTVDSGKQAGTAAKVCGKYPNKYSWCGGSAAPPPSGTILVPVPLTVGCPASSATAGSAYNSAITAAGGFPPYTRYSASPLPAGLDLNPATGAISGTPTGAGSSTFTASAVDSKGLSGSASCTITVASSCTVSGTLGCVTLSNVVLNNASGSGTVTLNGAFSFGPTDCPTLVCSGSAFGGGTYTTSGGDTGTFTVVGLEYESFNGPSCAQSSYRGLSVYATETGTGFGYLQVAVNPDGSNNVTFAPSGTVVATGTNVAGLSISC